MPDDEFKIPDAVSLRAMKEEMEARTKYRSYPWGSSAHTNPGYCDCADCGKQRYEMYKWIYNRNEQLNCQNEPWKLYCETHHHFYHEWDGACQDCRKPTFARRQGPDADYWQHLTGGLNAPNPFLRPENSQIRICPRCQTFPCECHTNSTK